VEKFQNFIDQEPKQKKRRKKQSIAGKQYRQQKEPVLYLDELRHRREDGKEGFKPTTFISTDNRKEVYDEETKDSTTMRANTRNYAKGTGYSDLMLFRSLKSLMLKGGEIELTIDLENGETTIVRIVDVSQNKMLIENVRATCDSIFHDPDFDDGHVRLFEKTGGLGRMAIVGFFWNEGKHKEQFATPSMPYKQVPGLEDYNLYLLLTHKW
jgi:hypothetical protein